MLPRDLPGTLTSGFELSRNSEPGDHDLQSIIPGNGQLRLRPAVLLSVDCHQVCECVVRRIVRRSRKGVNVRKRTIEYVCPAPLLHAQRHRVSQSVCACVIMRDCA